MKNYSLLFILLISLCSASSLMSMCEQEEQKLAGLSQEEYVQALAAQKSFERNNEQNYVAQWNPLDSFVTQINQSLGTTLATNEIPVRIDGKVILHNNPLYAGYINTLNHIRTVSTDFGTAVDITNLTAEAGLNAIQKLDPSTYQAFLQATAQQRLPWYKKYKSHIAVGISSILVTGLVTFGLTKWWLTNVTVQ